MPRKPDHGDKHHRFHDCRSDADRWRRLDEILMLIAGQIDQQDTSVRKQLSTISRKLSTLMTKADDLNLKVDELQASVDAMQERVTAHLATLTQTIADLEAQIGAPGDGITGAEADALLVKLQAAKDDLETTDAP